MFACNKNLEKYWKNSVIYEVENLISDVLRNGKTKTFTLVRDHDWNQGWYLWAESMLRRASLHRLCFHGSADAAHNVCMNNCLFRIPKWFHHRTHLRLVVWIIRVVIESFDGANSSLICIYDFFISFFLDLQFFSVKNSAAKNLFPRHDTS